MVSFLRESTKWYKRTSFCRKINFTANPHILMIISKKVLRDQLKSLSPKARYNWATHPSKLILVISKIISTEAKLKGQKKYNCLKITLCLKVGSMEEPIIKKTMSEDQLKSKPSSDLWDNWRLEDSSKEYLVTWLIIKIRGKESKLREYHFQKTK